MTRKVGSLLVLFACLIWFLYLGYIGIESYVHIPPHASLGIRSGPVLLIAVTFVFIWSAVSRIRKEWKEISRKRLTN